MKATAMTSVWLAQAVSMNPHRLSAPEEKRDTQQGEVVASPGPSQLTFKSSQEQKGNSGTQASPFSSSATVTFPPVDFSQTFY